MISIRRQHAPTAFGPQSSPLYYTALSRVPRRLIVAGLKGNRQCKLVLTVIGPDAHMQWILSGRPVNGVCAWLLTPLMPLTEVVCTWHIEESERSAADSRAVDHTAQAAPPPSGRFRLLDAPCRQRLIRGQQRLERVREGDIGSTADALFMAELGLYHEALSMVTSHLKNETKRGNQLLARTVQTLIYKQMLRQIEQEYRGDAAEDPRLGWYLTWTQNRERYHRELTVAMMKGQCPGRCLHEVAMPQK